MIDEPTGGGVPSEDTESESIEFVEPLPVGIRPHGDARFTPGVSLCSHGGGRDVHSSFDSLNCSSGEP